MMEVKEELRRIPIDKKFMTKKINDILYGYLQTISYIDKEKKRFVYKGDINFLYIERVLKGVFKRNTLKRNFDYLIACGFIELGRVEDLYGKTIEVYILPFKQKSIFKLIPLNTLKYLVNTTNPSVISVYAYLLNKWDWKGNEYVFTSQELIVNCLGLKACNKRDYERINNILDCLKRFKLIEFSTFYTLINNKPVPQKRLIKVEKNIKSD